MQYVIGKPEFIKNLDGWLAKNEQRYADYIVANKTGIPPMFQKSTDYLYRGMIVDADFLNKINKGTGVTLNRHSSWTKEKKVALAFTNDVKFKTATIQGTPIIIKKKIAPTQIVIDVHGFCLFMGEDQLVMLGLDDMSFDSAVKEQEVLVRKGVKVTAKDITIL